MAEYISRDTAIARLTRLEVTDNLATMADAKREIADMSAADVEPVVRCKDCKWYHAERGGFCDYHAAGVSPDWFCWNGERKDGEAGV